jgi:hypothetical protein
MDYSTAVLSYLKDEEIRTNINPVIYYGLKLVYNPNFKKRSKYFSKTLKQFLGTLGNTLDISLFNESIIEKQAENGGDLAHLNKTTINESIIIDLNYNNDPEQNPNIENLNISLNKECYTNMSNLFAKSWDWSLNLLFEADDEYILDKEDDYILLKLIKQYVFSHEDPKTSQLLISYNIFASSMELIYCLKLAENFPKAIFNPRELPKYNEFTEVIKYRIKLFYGNWIKMYKHKFEKNILIKEIIGKSAIGSNDDGTALDLISLSMVEPLLNSRYISFTKLIREGPFCFEIEEVARQICIIDHELLSTITIDDYNKFVYKKEVPESFNKFNIREKQLKCYILLFILMHNNLENKKNMIQNFISLAHICKLLQNQQTSFAIVSAFNLVDLSRKKLLWKLIEKKYREIFSNLEKDFNDCDLNDHYASLDSKNVTFPMVPHINRIKNNVNSFIIKQKTAADSESLMKISKDYKDFYLLMEGLSKNKYSFFKVNPLYDFFKFGFLEIFKPKKWNLKLRFDFSQITNDMTQLDQLLEFLITNFKKLDN